MNKQLKRVSIVMLLMFLALFASTSLIQVGESDTLAADGRNSRALYDSYSAQRGAILVDGQAVAQSVPSDDVYKFQREYPQGALYSSVTGYFPLGGEPTGIEGAMNGELSGRSNAQFLDTVTSVLTGKDPQGASVELTIDPVAQKAAYDALGSQQGAVVLLEPSTGKVLAMVSKPDYDPNALAVHDTAQVQSTYESLLGASGTPLINRAIRGDLNPPGSTFKPIVSSAAFSSGDYTPDSTLPNVAAYTLPQSSAVVRNDTGGACEGGTDTVTISAAQVFSCNIPFAELGVQLGSAAIKKQAEAYGFGRSLEIPMRVDASQYPGYAGDPAQTGLSAFGQAGDRATPLQMAMVSAAIANGGVVMYPNLVDSVKSPDFKTLESFQPRELSRATSSDVADQVKAMMVTGVQSGIATNARIDGVEVGGKTGTAQNGSGDPYTLWFTGFAPADDPKYAVAVVVEDGGGLGQRGSGNQVAAPIARKVLEAVLNK